MYEIIYYILQNTGGKLTKEKLKWILFLIDWKSCLERGSQLSSVEWEHGHPLGNEFKYNLIIPNSYSAKILKQDKYSVEIIKQSIWDRIFNKYIPYLGDNKTIIDYVLKKIKGKQDHQFVQFLYSTYPLYTTKFGEKMDLKNMVNQYKINYFYYER